MATDGTWEQERVVQDAEQARLLSDPRSLRYFEPFLARTRSVSEAAKEVGCALDTMYYRVRRFERAGLLQIVGERPRYGRPIKLYRSVAESFVVPFEATPFAELEERLRTQHRQDEDLIVRSMARLLRENRQEGRRILRGEDGKVNHESAGGGRPRFDWSRPEALVTPDRPVGESLSTELLLSEVEARAMLLALYRLVLSKPSAGADAAAAGEGRRRFYFRFTLLPVVPGSRD